MNKSALKTFATSARKELLKKVEAKAMKIGITEETIKKADVESSDAIFIGGKQLLQEEKVQRDKLIDRINQIGFNQVMEEVAYTWFNRFTALRYMEVNDYLPTGVRVLSSSNPNSADPDMINEALELDLEVEVDKEHIYNLKLNNETEELFKYLIIKHCNDLNRFLPFMFETIDDYTEILFPEGLLAKDSFIRQMTDIEFIPEDNWNKVEVIGWLYQYYIAEEKDRVIQAKIKYIAEEIPYATQLFTPDWIVRYMVQNSLGRYWVESHPEHRDILGNWEFYLQNPNSEPDFVEKLAPYINKELKVEDIKCFDPAMGSGHILVYMFDVLYEIYSKCGYMEREIPRYIIENNLFGLDIDDRAYQLASFSIVMKALEYNPRFFRSIERDGLKLNLASIQETNYLNEEDIRYITGGNDETRFNEIKKFVSQYKDAKLFGTLIELTSFPKEFLDERLGNIRENPASNIFEEESRSKLLRLLPQLIKQSEILSYKYDVLITNPPYLSSLYMNSELSNYIKENYTISKEDVYSCFILKSTKLVHHYGHIGMVCPYSWMVLSSYEKLRKFLIDKTTFSSIVELEYNSFEVATIKVAGFTLRNYDTSVPSECINLSKFPGIEIQPSKTIEAIVNPLVDYRFSSSKENFKKINGYPVAYWVSEKLLETFENNNSINDDFGEAKQGLASADNKRFLRLWFEVDINKISFSSSSPTDALNSNKKWFPHNKGGEYRKWYGNNYFVINWENDGYEIRNYKKSVIRNPQYYFREGITWSDLTAGGFSSRFSPEGKTFDSSGPTLFPYNKEEIFYGIAYLNTNLFQKLLNINCSGLHYSNGVIAGLPFIKPKNELEKNEVESLSKKCIAIAKKNWDDNEISWDYEKHPFLTFEEPLVRVLNEKIINLQKSNFSMLKSTEEKINSIFNEEFINEVSSEVDEKKVAIKITNAKENVISFISYFIGCIFGRYSLDNDGIIFAGGQFEPNKYQTFITDKDNILPILSGAYIEDDIVSRFEEFLQVTFGENNLAENLEFIANTLAKKKGETAKETIRRYFSNDFFKDHVQTYKKRPIYWLFTSGKEKAFNCLIYMHRYDKTTLSRIRTDYLHEYQIRLDAEKKDLLSIIEGDYTAKEISNAKKELKTLDKKIEELKEYDELLHHMADMQIEIDLDDGVLVNYEKFKGLVAKI